MRALRTRFQTRSLRARRSHHAVLQRGLSLGVVLGVVTLGLGLPVGAVASATSPDDFLCYVEGSSQSTPLGATFNVPLQVEISSTSCDAPTPDLATYNSVTFSVITSSNGPSASFSPLATVLASNGEASVFATANYVAGAFSVVATSASTASNASAPSVVFNLTTTTLVPASIAVGLASSQAAPLDSAFALALSATVDDSSGNPVPGVQVSFRAPASGASGTFAGTAASDVTVVTDTAGVAIAPAFYANSTVGGYVVTASVTGLSQEVAFALVNEATTIESVTAVTPSGVAEGATDVAVTVSGSGFASGAVVIFNDTGITVNATTFQSSTSLLVNVSVSRSAATGIQSVSVMNPGGPAVTGGFIFNVSRLVLVRPATISIPFSISGVGLNARARARLRAFSLKLVPGATVWIVGYATTSRLAALRERSVTLYLRRRIPGLHVTVTSVASKLLKVVRVITTAN